MRTRATGADRAAAADDDDSSGDDDGDAAAAASAAGRPLSGVQARQRGPSDDDEYAGDVAADAEVPSSPAASLAPVDAPAPLNRRSSTRSRGGGPIGLQNKSGDDGTLVITGPLVIVTWRTAAMAVAAAAAAAAGAVSAAAAVEEEEADLERVSRRFSRAACVSCCCKVRWKRREGLVSGALALLDAVASTSRRKADVSFCCLAPLSQQSITTFFPSPGPYLTFHPANPSLAK